MLRPGILFAVDGTISVDTQTAHALAIDEHFDAVVNLTDGNHRILSGELRREIKLADIVGIARRLSIREVAEIIGPPAQARIDHVPSRVFRRSQRRNVELSAVTLAGVIEVPVAHQVDLLVLAIKDGILDADHVGARRFESRAHNGDRHLDRAGSAIGHVLERYRTGNLAPSRHRAGNSLGIQNLIRIVRIHDRNLNGSLRTSISRIELMEHTGRAERRVGTSGRHGEAHIHGLIRRGDEHGRHRRVLRHRSAHHIVGKTIGDTLSRFLHEFRIVFARTSSVLMLFRSSTKLHEHIAQIVGRTVGIGHRIIDRRIHVGEVILNTALGLGQLVVDAAVLGIPRVAIRSKAAAGAGHKAKQLRISRHSAAGIQHGGIGHIAAHVHACNRTETGFRDGLAGILDIVNLVDQPSQLLAEVIALAEARQNDQHTHAVAIAHRFLHLNSHRVGLAVAIAVLRHDIHNRILQTAASKARRLDDGIIYRRARADRRDNQQHQHSQKKGNLRLHLLLS